MGKFLGFDTEHCFDYENGFYLTSHVTRIGKLLAHYELYKRIIDLPGQIVECGVFKGTSLLRFATFREVLESPYSRKIIGFDAFGKFPVPPEHDDAQFVEQFERMAGQGISVEELTEVFRTKSLSNYELVQGDILDTVPEYLEKHPELKIALLHVDVDVYQPTLAILENLYERVVRGGIIVFDDFAVEAGTGETRAIDEFFADKQIVLKKLSISHVPTYMVK